MADRAIGYYVGFPGHLARLHERALIRNPVVRTLHGDGQLDPTARRMDGIAGHAGLFSTADDLAIFARMLLDGGAVGGARILSRESIASMTRPQSPPAAVRLRGLGWGLASPIASDHEEGERTRAYEHTGYTGTMMWLDPGSRSYVIVLSNRTYQDGRGDAQPLRRAILSQVSAALGS